MLLAEHGFHQGKGTLPAIIKRQRNGPFRLRRLAKKNFRVIIQRENLIVFL